jgi:hypothetical protein
MTSTCERWRNTTILQKQMILDLFTFSCTNSKSCIIQLFVHSVIQDLTILKLWLYLLMLFRECFVFCLKKCFNASKYFLSVLWLFCVFSCLFMFLFWKQKTKGRKKLFYQAIPPLFYLLRFTQQWQRIIPWYILCIISFLNRVKYFIDICGKCHNQTVTLISNSCLDFKKYHR